ncbi:putative reverse transcriptase domain-containing protein [Tanacetum coccineum]
MQLTSSWTVSSKVPEMSKNRTLQGQVSKSKEPVVDGARVELCGGGKSAAESKVGPDLLPTRLGSFDVIIGMDWLAYYRALIDCYEKIVRIPLPMARFLKFKARGRKRILDHLHVSRLMRKSLMTIVSYEFTESMSSDCLGLPHEVRRLDFAIDRSQARSPVVRSPLPVSPFKIVTGIVRTSSKELQGEGFYSTKSLTSGEHLCSLSRRRRYQLIRVQIFNMYYDLRDLYWWPGMKRDIAEYVSSVLHALRLNANTRTSGLSSALIFLSGKWEKSAHFLPIREDYKTEKLAKIYVNKIVARHGVRFRDVKYFSTVMCRFTSSILMASSSGSIGYKTRHEYNLPPSDRRSE